MNEIKTDNNLSITDNAFFKSVARGGAAIIAIVRAPGMNLVFVNDIFERFLGYSNTDVEQHPISFYDLMDNNQRERLSFQINNISQDFDPYSTFLIYQLSKKSGEQLPFLIYASPLQADKGSGAGLYHLTLHPYSSRWDMPFMSTISRDLFLEQFSNENFGTFEWIIEADKVFWSKGAYNIYELDETTVDTNYKFMESFIHPDDKKRIKEATMLALDSGSDMNTEYKIITAKQNIKTIHYLGSVIKNKDGKKLMLAGSIRDITNQRLIEKDLKDKVDELHHSNRELEDFAYVASHDLQEPLRKITTFSDRLSEKYKELLTGDGAMYLSRMTASAENMRKLINDLLEFSRISKNVLPYEPVSLDAILKQVGGDLELVIEETGTVINSDQLPEIEAVASQMKQLFGNIINNAIKFHKIDVTPVITIETSILSEKERKKFDLKKNVVYHKVQITDNGIGFENEYAQRIFQVFQRLHGKSEYPGSGIGLAICKKILEHHHGLIYAESIPDKGARFTFIIPQSQQMFQRNSL
jgi:PAS domain S-box-containing protein